MNRPQLIQYAVVLIAVLAVGGIAFAAGWPDLDDRDTVLPVSIVAGILMLITAWFVWNGNKWGTIAAIALQGLNILASLPWYADPDPASVTVVVTICIALSVAAIVLLLMPRARGYWLR